MTEPTAPGWYADPDDADLLRYYDGVVWTAHTTPLRSPTAASSSIGHAPVVESAAERQAAQEARRRPQQQWSAPPAWGTRPDDVLPDGDVVAEWWRRLLGWVVDSVLTSLVAGVLVTPFLGGLVDALETYFADALAGRTPDDAAFEAALADVALPVTLMTLGVGLVYHTVFLVWRGATPGKMLLGTVVRPVGAAGRISLVVALRRQVIGVVTSLFGLNPLLAVPGFVLSVVDPAWLLWDPKRQCLHDKVADTVVVRRR